MATNDNDPATLLVEALRRMETNEASLHRLTMLFDSPKRRVFASSPIA